MELLVASQRTALLSNVRVCKWDFVVWYEPARAVYLMRGKGKEPKSFKDGKVRLMFDKGDLQNEFGTVRKALEHIAASNRLKLVKKMGPSVEIDGFVDQDPLFIFC